jgi:hypothetical protein
MVEILHFQPQILAILCKFHIIVNGKKWKILLNPLKFSSNWAEQAQKHAPLPLSERAAIGTQVPPNKPVRADENVGKLSSKALAVARSVSPGA